MFFSSPLQGNDSRYTTISRITRCYSDNLNRDDKLVNYYERTNFIKPVIELKTL